MRSIQRETRQTIGARLLASLAAMSMIFAVMAYAFAGGLAPVVVETSPEGAQVLIGGQVVGTTPATLELPADTKVRIQIEKKGYQTRTISVTPSEGKTKRVKVTLKKDE